MPRYDNGAAVESRSKLYGETFAKAMLAADVHGVGINAPTGTVKGKLIGGNDSGITIPGNIKSIAKVVTVTVADKDKIRFQVIGGGNGFGIAGEIRVKEQGLTAFDQKGTVT